MIYFIQKADGTGPIKIGTTKALEIRIKIFEAWCPDPMKLLHVAKGGFSEERALHIKLDKYRLHGEWFSPEPEVLSAIEEIKNGATILGKVADDRTAEMARLYRSGETLQQIGDKYGLTRERVRQIFRSDGIESLGIRTKQGEQA